MAARRALTFWASDGPVDCHRAGSTAARDANDCAAPLDPARNNELNRCILFCMWLETEETANAKQTSSLSLPVSPLPPQPQYTCCVFPCAPHELPRVRHDMMSGANAVNPEAAAALRAAEAVIGSGIAGDVAPRAPFQVQVEHLDYGYIGKCENSRELEKI